MIHVYSDDRQKALEYGILTLTWIHATLTCYFIWRQIHRIEKKNHVPPELANLGYQDKDLHSSGSNAKGLLWVHILDNAGGAVIITLVIKFALMYKLYGFCGRMADPLRNVAPNYITHHFWKDVIFAMSCILIHRAIHFSVEMIHLYIEKQHGHVEHSVAHLAWHFFLVTIFKLFYETAIEKCLVKFLKGLMHLFQHGYWWTLGALGTLYWIIFPSTCVFHTLRKSNKYKPLPEGEIKDRLDALADKTNFPKDSILVLKNSKSKVHPNAFHYKFLGYTRLVIYDSLVNGKGRRNALSPEQVEAVVAHELGHYAHSHSFTMVTYFQLLVASVICSMVLLLRWKTMYQVFGFPMGMSDEDVYKSLAPGIIMLELVVISYPLEIVQTIFRAFMRNMEDNADRYAVTLGYGTHLQEALVKIATDNTDYPDEDYFFTLINSSHPPVLSRIRNIEEAMKKLH